MSPAAISKTLMYRFTRMMFFSVFKAGLKTNEGGSEDPPLQLSDRYAHATRDAVFADEHVDVHCLRLCGRRNPQLAEHRPRHPHSHDANRLVGHERSADHGNGRVLIGGGLWS